MSKGYYNSITANDLVVCARTEKGRRNLAREYLIRHQYADAINLDQRVLHLFLAQTRIATIS